LLVGLFVDVGKNGEIDFRFEKRKNRSSIGIMLGYVAMYRSLLSVLSFNCHTFAKGKKPKKLIKTKSNSLPLQVYPLESSVQKQVEHANLISC
jgi:hypothetical protein